MAEDKIDEEVFMDDSSIAIEDTENGSEDASKSGNIIPFIMERYKKADDYREQDEQRWLRAYRNYRGLYGSDVQFTEAEKSRVFIKVTKTKTLAAYGQIVDVLFANNKFPLTVEPTELPEGVVCLLRERKLKTNKVSEYTYMQMSAAKRRTNKIIKQGDSELTICTHSQVAHIDATNL